MQTLRVLTIAFCGVLVAARSAHCQQTDTPSKTGPAIGMTAPSFKLKDQSGKERSLDEFLKKGNVALVFFRSAGW